MNSQGDELHPNWRALATVHLPLKRFIKAGEEALIDGARNQEGQKYTITGVNSAEVKNFYEQLVKADNNKGIKQNAINSKPTAPISINPAKPKLKFDKAKFFRCAQTNDFNILRDFELNGVDINVRDQYGWSALMMAACEGALEAVEVLLGLGANRHLKDKAGKTALSLARQKGNVEIVKLLENETYQSIVNLEPAHFQKEQRVPNPFIVRLAT